MKTLLYSFSIIFIIVSSFFLYSSNYFADFNSDDAITVLMLHDFKLPGDLYFWQQDRYGSIIPLAGQFFFKVFHISALTSESITHYLILIAGYLAFCTLFKSRWNRFAFAIVWFFPPIRQIDLLRFNLGIEYSLIAMAIFFLNVKQTSRTYKKNVSYHFRVITAMILLTASAWVSDLAILTITLLLSFQVFFFLKDRGSGLFNYRTFITTPEIYYILTGLASGISFIAYAKSTGVKAASYSAFAEFGTIMDSLKIFFRTILDFLLFRVHDPLTGVYSYLILILVLPVIFMYLKKKFILHDNKWMLFFIFDGILILFLIFSSHWVNLNGVARRYFVSIYISFWVAFLIALDRLELSKFKKAIQTILIITVIIGGAGTIYTLKYIFPKTLKPKAEIVKEFRTLGKAGIIADYWSSYIVSAVSPDQIVATAHDKAIVRNKDFVKKVFEQPGIYIINGSWLKTYPDTLVQFGHVLIKGGEQFRIGNSNVCKYRLIR